MARTGAHPSTLPAPASSLPDQEGLHQRTSRGLAGYVATLNIPQKMQRANYGFNQFLGQKQYCVGPGWVAQWVRASTRYTEVVGSIPVRAHTRINQ